MKKAGGGSKKGGKYSSKSKKPATGTGKKSSSSAASDNDITEALEAEQMSELIKNATQLKAECARKKEETNNFRQKLEELVQYWGAEKKALEEKKEVVQKKQSQLRSTKDKHQLRLDSKRQDILKLRKQQENELARTNMQIQANLKALQISHRTEENDLIDESNQCDASLREIEVSHDELRQRLQDQQSLSLSKLRDEFRHRSSDVAIYSERQMKKTRQDLELQQSEAIATVEKTIDDRVRQALGMHERVLFESRQKYNTLVMTNMDIVKSLKGEVLQLRKEQRRRDKVLGDTVAKNRAIVGPLAVGKEALSQLRKQETLHSLQKEELDKERLILSTAEQELKDQKFSNEVVLQRIMAERRKTEQTATQKRAQENTKNTSSNLDASSCHSKSSLKCNRCGDNEGIDVIPHKSEGNLSQPLFT